MITPAQIDREVFGLQLDAFNGRPSPYKRTAMTTETDIARGVADGTLRSPTAFLNSSYVALRISGTGAAWRDADNEFTWRDPTTWLSDQMLRRVLGLPVLVGHPDGRILNSREFADRVVGQIVWSFRSPDNRSLWGVARILDQNAVDAIADGEVDTSPAVKFGPGQLPTATLSSGHLLVIEPEPVLIDHIALCIKGVWRRTDGPGVLVDPQ